MGNIAVKPKPTALARPIKVLVPLIQRELDSADHAGLNYYCRAGAMLLEARDQVAPFKWTAWLSKNFALSGKQASRYIKLAERVETHGRPSPDMTLTEAIGESLSDATRRVGVWRPIKEFTAQVDADRLSQERQTRIDEVRLHRELALELIDIGYRALATRLHPDRDGSKDAMRRLNRVRHELKAVAETRRFE